MRDELIEKMARSFKGLDDEYVGSSWRWEDLSEYGQNSYRDQAKRVWPLIVEFVAEWLERYGNGWPEDTCEHYQGEGHALTHGETEDLVAAWREAMQP